MKIVRNLVFLMLTFEPMVSHPAELDSLMGYFRHFRREAFNVLNETVASRENMKLLKKEGKLQRFNREKFPCDLDHPRSPQSPKSVHQLRPGDIDVIAGIGDSLTAGVGSLATNIIHVSLEHRGHAPTAGGKGSWRKYLTLPNILKAFNPNLVGYATDTSTTLHPESNLNVAETAAMSKDMPYMAQVLIQRMKENPLIDINKHWKMVTVMIGPNDFCSRICFEEEDMQAILDNHTNELREVLTIFKKNLPKTLVNLIPPPNLKLLLDMTNKSGMCHMQHLIECPCLFGPSSKNRQNSYVELMRRWQDVDIEFGNDPQFDDEDFSVVVQPFSVDFFTLNTTAGTTDYSYFSEDCFHMSQKGNARIANSLWNNIMEPVGKKSHKPVKLLFEEVKCPSIERSFIFTRRNSKQK